MFNGLETPTEGEVIVDGANIGQLSKQDLRLKRQKVSMIFQHFNLLWSRTVKDNIAFPLEIAGVSKSEINERTKELIKRVGLEGRENAYPSQLSGGQNKELVLPVHLLMIHMSYYVTKQQVHSIRKLLMKY